MAKVSVTRTANRKPEAYAGESWDEQALDKLISSKSILQCAAAATHSDSQDDAPDEPSWALEAAVDLMQDVMNSIPGQDPKLWLPLARAYAVANAAIVAHDCAGSHSRDVDLPHVLATAADLLNEACRRLDERSTAKASPSLKAVVRS